jgi:hypothetical protein
VSSASVLSSLEAERDVILGEDLAELVEVGIEEALLVVREAPAGHDRAAAADDASNPVGG